MISKFINSNSLFRTHNKRKVETKSLKTSNASPKYQKSGKFLNGTELTLHIQFLQKDKALNVYYTKQIAKI